MMKRLKSIASTGFFSVTTMLPHGWSPEDFAVVYKGVSRWKIEGKKDALWLNYRSNAAAERARTDLVKHHHAKDVSVLGTVVVVNGGIEQLEQEIDAIKVRKHLTAKLRTAMQGWHHKGRHKPLVLEFLSQGEVKCAKSELKGYVSKNSEGAIAYGTKLIIPSKLAEELGRVAG